MIKRGAAVAVLALTLVLLSAAFPALADAAPLVINEVSSANGKAIKDQDGESPDWIELYNPTGEAVDLTGFCLSDDASEPDKFIFDKTTIEPYGYALVFASRKLNMSPEWHADFRLSSEGGESVYLFAPGGALLDTVILPSLEKDVSYGRRFDGGDALGRISPTPGASNNTALSAEPGVFVAPPSFSHESGFYDGDIEISLSASDGMTVYYTLDGSEPSAHSTLYTTPLTLDDASLQENVYSMLDNQSVRTYYKPSTPVDKCHVIRAVAVDAEGNKSAIVSKSYFVGFAEKGSCENIAVVSLITDPDNLFGYENGIYTTGVVHDEWMNGSEFDPTITEYWQPANYQQRGREWEREAELTYFTADRQHAFTQAVGMRVHGRITRASVQKSFNIYARDEYGGDTLTLPIFEGERETSSLILRTGGNDAAMSKIRDAFAQSLVADRAIDTQAAIPCAVFLDGEYWGMYFLEQRYDDDYIKEQYGIDQRNVVMAEYGKLEEGKEGEYALYTAVVDFASKNDLSLEKNIQKLGEMIDLDSLIDYFAVEIFLSNSDWPWNNYTVWRSRDISDRAYEDGRWRYMLNDLDQTMGYDATLSGYARDTLALAEENPIFNALLDNGEFRERFALTFMDLCNTVFAPEHTVRLLNYLEKTLTNATVADYRRVRNAVRGIEYYANSIAVIREFLEKREEYITKYISDHFALSGVQTDLTLSVNGATMGGILLNTVVPDVSSAWTGRYFVDYPVTLTAGPKNGYRFSHWVIENGSVMGDVTQEEIKVRLSALGTTATAVFEPIAETQARETLVEFNYSEKSAALKGNSMQGYAATGGLNAENARLTASVDGEKGRKLEWSNISYDNGGVTPVMRANNKNRWSQDAYIDVSFSSFGYDSLCLSVSLGADWQGARGFSLAYSPDGDQYEAIEGSDIVISTPERMTAAYVDFALPDALKNQKNLHIRISVSGDQTVRGRAKLTGLTEGEVAVNGLRVTGRKIPVDPSAYLRAAAALENLGGLPQKDADAVRVFLDGFTTENQTQSVIDAQTEKAYALAETLPFSREGTESALSLLPETAREKAVCVRVPDGIYQLVYPIYIDLSSFEEAFVYRFEDGVFTLEKTVSLPDRNTERFAFTQAKSGLYLIFDRLLSVYSTACTVTPVRMADVWEEGELPDHLISASAWLDVQSLGVGFDGHIEIDLKDTGFRGSVWGYREDDASALNAAFSVPLRDGILRVDDVSEGRYLLLSHNAEGVENNVERAQRLREKQKETSAEKRWLLSAGAGIVLCCMAFAGWKIAARYRKKRKK